MSAQPTGTLALEIYDRFNDGDFAAILPLATDDWEGVVYHVGMTFRGKDGLMQFLEGFKGPFPDCKVTITNQVLAENQIVNEITWTGTHTGPLHTPSGVIPPTERTVHASACEVWQLRGGKVASVRNYQDSMAILAQLGLLPQPGPEGL